MKNNFSAVNQHWDRYKIFHSSDEGFTSFISGEVSYNPYICKDYDEYGLSVRSTSYSVATWSGIKYRFLDPVVHPHIIAEIIK